MLSGAHAPCVAALLVARGDSDQELSLAKAPAVIALLLYFSVALIQWIQWWRNDRKGLSVLPIGMSCYAIGMILRAGNNYAWQFLFTFLSPCAFLAACYIILSRLAASLDPAVAAECLIVNQKAISWGFIASDVITFCTQCAGTVFVILGGNWLSLGEALAIGGLCLALLSFTLFSVTAWIFAKRLHSRHPQIYHSSSNDATRPSASRNPFARVPINDPRLLFRLLAVSIVGVLVRSVFRLIEQSTGFFGPIARKEALFYVLDSLPLWLAMLVWAVVWPKRFFEGSLGARMEASEMQVSGYAKANQWDRDWSRLRAPRQAKTLGLEETQPSDDGRL